MTWSRILIEMLINPILFHENTGGGGGGGGSEAPLL